MVNESPRYRPYYAHGIGEQIEGEIIKYLVEQADRGNSPNTINHLLSLDGFFGTSYFQRLAEYGSKNCVEALPHSIVEGITSEAMRVRRIINHPQFGIYPSPLRFLPFRSYPGLRELIDSLAGENQEVVKDHVIGRTLWNETLKARQNV